MGSASTPTLPSVRSDGVVTVARAGNTEFRSDGVAMRFNDTFTLGPSGLETTIGNFTFKPDGTTAFHF